MIFFDSDQGALQGTDNPLPIFNLTRALHRSHFNKGCYRMLHTPFEMLSCLVLYPKWIFVL